MDHETMRIKASELAQAEGLKGDAAIRRAQELFDFWRYGRDGATETRKLVDGKPIPQARVVGRDDDIIDALRKQDGYEKE